MSTQLIDFEIVPENAGLELSAKSTLEAAFAGFFAEAAKWADHAKTITEPKLARVARLELKALRVKAEKKRKELKEDSLRMGKAIDGANNILLAHIVPIEKQLEDIEKEEERREAARIEALREERQSLLAEINHEHFGANLGTMTADQWAEYYQGAKDAFTARQEREAKAKAEAEALAKKEAEEREAQRLENIRLKAEAEKREAEMKAEREAAAKAEEDARKERLRLQAIAETERVKAAAAAEAAAAKQAALEAEAARLREAEERRVAAEEASAKAKAEAEAAAAKKAAAAPDKSKLMEFAGIVRALSVPAVSNPDAAAVRSQIEEKVQSFAKWIESQASKL